MRSTLIAFAILTVLFFASHGEARATLRVCDTTTEPVTVAIAVLAPGAGGFDAQSEGWFKINSLSCQLVIDTDLTRERSTISSQNRGRSRGLGSPASPRRMPRSAPTTRANFITSTGKAISVPARAIR